MVKSLHFPRRMGKPGRGLYTGHLGLSPPIRIPSMRASRWLSLLFALLLLAGCGQKGALYHSDEPRPASSDTPATPAPDATTPSEPQPPSDF